MSRTPTRVVLVGGGHAHIQVIKAFKGFSKEIIELVLISDGPTATYSGMLPGCIAGLYSEAETQLELAPIAKYAGIRFIQNCVTSINIEEKVVYCSDGSAERYDIVSVDVGSQTAQRQLPGVAEVCLPTRPIKLLPGRVRAAEAALQAASVALPQVVVVGGGVAGVELAFAMHARWSRQFGAVQVTLVHRGERLPSGGCRMMQRLTRKKLRAVGIRTQLRTAAVRAEPGVLHCVVSPPNSSGSSDAAATDAAVAAETEGTALALPFHTLLWAGGAAAIPLPLVRGAGPGPAEAGGATRAAEWLGKTQEDGKTGVGGEAKAGGAIESVAAGGDGSGDGGGDEDAATTAPAPAPTSTTSRVVGVTAAGYLRVLPTLQSTESNCVFAAGDCSQLEGQSPNFPPKAGVYAVRAGSVLIHNIQALLHHRPLIEYDPPTDFLRLLMTGDGAAIGAKFSVAFSGQWVWRWKDKIDVSFMRMFQPATMQHTPTQFLPDTARGARTVPPQTIQPATRQLQQPLAAAVAPGESTAAEAAPAGVAVEEGTAVDCSAAVAEEQKDGERGQQVVSNGRVLHQAKQQPASSEEAGVGSGNETEEEARVAASPPPPSVAAAAPSPPLEAEAAQQAAAVLCCSDGSGEYEAPAAVLAHMQRDPVFRAGVSHAVHTAYDDEEDEEDDKHGDGDDDGDDDGDGDGGRDDGSDAQQCS